MGFVGSAEAVVARAIARVMAPPPPPDITGWCERNIVFDARSPFPGPFDISRFPFLREIHDVLSPEHPAREVTVRGSAQWGKTVSVLNPTIAAWLEYAPVDVLVVHPTANSAKEWVRTKWLPMRRQAPGLRRLFGDAGAGAVDTLFDQETVMRTGSLKVASAGSPDDLAGTTRRLVLMDDVAKFEMTPKGDPEQLASSRAAAFEDAKIVRISTPQVEGTCRITRAWDRSDQRLFEVPCPHCDTYAPLTWDNFKRSIRPDALEAAHFTCDSCGCAIEHHDKERIVARGRWVAQNPNGDHPGFHLWRAYVPQRDWASIATDYARVMGWTKGASDQDAAATDRAPDVEEETEQTFWNDVLGLPFKTAVKGPDWERLRDRAKALKPPRARGVVPAGGWLLTAGVDVQEGWLAVQIVAWGANFARHVVDYYHVHHHISTDEARAALDGLLKAGWRTDLGRRVQIDALAIDGGAYTDDVWDWAMRHPVTRVIVTKGASSQSAPPMKRMAFAKKDDRRWARKQRQGWITGVSQMKGEFYGRLDVIDPALRGHVGFAQDLGDDYYRELTAEVREIKRTPSGATVSKWRIAVEGQRNEALDTMLIAEAAARLKAWHYLTPEQWDALAMERGGPPDDDQGDLFAALPAAPAKAAKSDAPPAPPLPAGAEVTPDPKPEPPRDPRPGHSWLGGRVGQNWLKR